MKQTSIFDYIRDVTEEGASDCCPGAAVIAGRCSDCKENTEAIKINHIDIPLHEEEASRAI